MQLRKVCNHPFLIKGIDQKNFIKQVVQQCGKMQLLDRMLPILKSNGHKVLIFSLMTKMLDILEEYLKIKGYSFCRIGI